MGKRDESESEKGESEKGVDWDGAWSKRKRD
eukprot:CAMPEP_0185851566 /NCGR_PEP_ID=MMETSP1354-20130828/10432_1 /TAXON_ID=708628 /ORGANISM="Erythrolobus madagascarensis, Strain CCMP3276" /LENGTH=30 /DNA_ID= /DNA_START= /DNA_END= /DNA_ORIENTATION=